MDWIRVLNDLENFRKSALKLLIPGIHREKIIKTIEFEIDLIKREAFMELGKVEY